MVEEFDNVLAIIPARRESKRLPGKNKMVLLGRPLWENTVNIAWQAGINVIAVSTDDNEILQELYPNKVNSKVIGFKRSNEAAGDDASMHDVICEVMQQVSQYAIQYDTICLLQPTSSLLTITTLKHALHQYYSKKYQCLVAVNKNYKPCGAFYILNKDSFIKHSNIWMPGMAIYVVNEKEAIDIDYIWDLRIAEAITKGNVIES